MTVVLKNKFDKNINEVKKHIYRIDKAFKILKDRFEFDLTKENIEEIFESDELVTLIDQIVYRFSKLQDTLGKILRLYCALKGEIVENLSIIDIINLADKIGIDISKEKWFELRELRNVIAHEYEDEHEEIAKLLNKIYRERDYLRNLIKQLENV